MSDDDWIRRGDAVKALGECPTPWPHDCTLGETEIEERRSRIRALPASALAAAAMRLARATMARYRARDVYLAAEWDDVPTAREAHLRAFEQEDEALAAFRAALAEEPKP